MREMEIYQQHTSEVEAHRGTISVLHPCGAKTSVSFDLIGVFPFIGKTPDELSRSHSLSRCLARTDGIAGTVSYPSMDRTAIPLPERDEGKRTGLTSNQPCGFLSSFSFRLLLGGLVAFRYFFVSFGLSIKRQLLAT